MSLRDIIREKSINSILHAIVSAYAIMRKVNPFTSVPIENERRNHLVETLKAKKLVFKGDCIITTEESTYNRATFEEKGRIDIKIYFGYNKRNIIVFECKRFISSNMTTKHIQDEYWGNGIERFTIQKKYPTPWNYAGMISFVESGDFEKLNTLLVNAIETASDEFTDLSTEFSHQYLYEGKIDDINFNHVIMNFT